MPKTVDHGARRRQLADAAIAVIARYGLGATTLALVAEEAGWSIGSMRYYFPTKTELIASALRRVGERVDERIGRRTAGGMTLADLRGAVVELLPLDHRGGEESRVWLAFMAEASVEPELADAADGAAQRLQAPLAARIAKAIKAGDLRPDLDPEREAERLRVLRDGLALHLVTTPRLASNEWALRMLDDHLAALMPRPERGHAVPDTASSS